MAQVEETQEGTINIKVRTTSGKDYALSVEKDIDIDDERKLRTLYDMRVSQVVDGSNLGDEFTGESSEPSDLFCSAAFSLLKSLPKTLPPMLSTTKPSAP